MEDDDRLFGDAGADALDAKDGEHDTTINCGPGGGDALIDAGLDSAPIAC